MAALAMLMAWFTAKGSRLHRRAGKVFVIAFMVSLVMALILALMRSNIFLLLIALFSAYLVYSGWRAAVNRQGVQSRFDRFVMLEMQIVAVGMLLYGLMLVAAGNLLGIAVAVFGVIGGTLAFRDFRRKSGWPLASDRIVSHLIRMGSASIATLTAVLVVNVDLQPAWLVWLLPTLLLTPGIIVAARRTRAGHYS